MCGLFGWTGVSVENFNYTKLKLMGLLNDERGGDGFGLFNGINVFKSIIPGKLKEGLKDPEKLHSIVPLEFPIFMGHTRKKSTGRIDMEHTQPIIWDLEGLKSCTMHNGTIDDLEDLISSLKMKKVLDNIHSLSDTQVLSRILHQLKLEGRNLSEVLNIYSGTAALLIYFNSEPNGFYIFRGSSKWYDTSTLFSEERPLFFSIEKNKGVYISSIEESLSYISEGLDFTKPVEIPSNILFRIEGDTMVEVETIDRSTIARYGNNPVTQRTYKTGFYEDDDYYSKRHVPATIPLIKTYEREGVTIRENPTHDYITTGFNNFYVLANSKFKGNHIAALEYLSRVYSSTSIFKYTPQLINVSPEKGSKIVFYKGRYIVTSSTSSTNAWGILANGIFHVNSKGIINYNIPGPEDTKMGFRHGVLVSLKDSKFVTDELSFSKIDSLYSTALITFEYNLVFGNTSPIYEHLVEPVALFHYSGKMYSSYSENIVSLYSGIYEPLFSKVGYHVKNGYISSSYVRAEISKSVSKPKKWFSDSVTPKFKKMVLCPECYAEVAICAVCDGNGYMEEEAVRNYKNISLNCCDDSYEDLINQSVAEEIQELQNSVVEVRNIIMSMDSSTAFSATVVTLLDTFELNLIEAMSYG